MANFIPIANTSGITILNPGDIALIGPGILVASSSTTIGGADFRMQNRGTVLGNVGVQMDGQSVLYNFDTGTISASTTGVLSVASANPVPRIIDNAGTIFGERFGIFQDSSSNSLFIDNSGSIVAGYNFGGLGNAAVCTASPTTLRFENSGLIRTMLGDSFAIQDAANSVAGVQIITNRGTIIGKVGLGGGDDVFDTAAGKVLPTVAGFASTAAIDGGAGADTITGSALADTILGGTEADTLKGNAGNDVLNGGDGNDTIFGAAGVDRISCGNGNDSIFFNTAPNSSTNRDIISDFSHVADVFRMENAVFIRLGAAGGLNPAFFRAGAAALDANDFIVYNQATGALGYDSNGNAAGGLVQVALLQNRPGLAANDFVVF